MSGLLSLIFCAVSRMSCQALGARAGLSQAIRWNLSHRDRRADGVGPQTVTNISRRLLEMGIIEEAGKLTTALGKPRTALRPRADGLYSVGIQFDPDSSSAVLLDLAGTAVLRRDFTPSPGSGPYEVLETLVSAYQDLIAAATVGPDRILGLGVAAPGPLDVERGVLLDPPHLPRWHQIPVLETLEKGTGVPVVLDKDVTAAAVAAAWYGRGTREPGETVAVIYIGTGIGLGVYIDGEVFRGAAGNAGEVGHLIVDPEGHPCTCGMRGCVGVTSSPSSLVARILPQQGRVITGMNAIVEGARVHPEWDLALQQATDGILQLAKTVTRLYDVNRIFFGGPMWSHFEGRLSPKRLEEFSQTLTADSTHSVRVRASDLGVDLGAVGAASLVFDNFLAPRLSTLMLGSQDADATATPY